jgi:antitoxin (DNA-binding transcriptional repressor) of toxin-antitoxin stability system
MSVTVEQLRADLERLLDRILDTGEALVVEHHGRRLRIEPASRLDRIAVNPDVVVGDADELARLGWTERGEPVLRPHDSEDSLD